jgi:hypothetical protein
MSDQNPREQGAFGSPAPGSPAPGSPAAGSPAPGSPAPGSPAAGPSAPGSAPAGPSAPGPSGEAPADSSAGFFQALFDVSFTTFVTPTIVRIVYVLAIVWAAVVYVLVVVGGFATSVGTGLVVLVFGPVAAVIWLAIVRICLELGVSVVRMSEDVHRRLPQPRQPG